eukprot:CAMPEP_0195037020 /NCGR_PEP_ID=MMETSP0326_2-20130528/73961_1 /TAXON_ID=2866 ORGANISM="Crypthecodinium cohnii, Strain Seligo" /NCGR_SAMPLE_ID=MMETSP0326_2 /ASSEMBLY_ACC=CAM_ASM_000348 /LENGTH=141 /DNA_ID=CAMNT_0040062845 /DNA_START=36 /DNA_END=462 /DNA_ORIENTATION=+
MHMGKMKALSSSRVVNRQLVTCLCEQMPRPSPTGQHGQQQLVGTARSSQGPPMRKLERQRRLEECWTQIHQTDSVRFSDVGPAKALQNVAARGGGLCAGTLPDDCAKLHIFGSQVAWFGSDVAVEAFHRLGEVLPLLGSQR